MPPSPPSLAPPRQSLRLNRICNILYCLAHCTNFLWFLSQPENTLPTAVTAETLTLGCADKLPKAVTLDFSFAELIIAKYFLDTKKPRAT